MKRRRYKNSELYDMIKAGATLTSYRHINAIDVQRIIEWRDGTIKNSFDLGETWEYSSLRDLGDGMNNFYYSITSPGITKQYKIY